MVEHNRRFKNKEFLNYFNKNAFKKQSSLLSSMDFSGNKPANVSVAAKRKIVKDVLIPKIELSLGGAWQDISFFIQEALMEIRYVAKQNIFEDHVVLKLLDNKRHQWKEYFYPCFQKKIRVSIVDNFQSYGWKKERSWGTYYVTNCSVKCDTFTGESFCYVQCYLIFPGEILSFRKYYERTKLSEVFSDLMDCIPQYSGDFTEVYRQDYLISGDYHGSPLDILDSFFIHYGYAFQILEGKKVRIFPLATQKKAQDCYHELDYEVTFSYDFEVNLYAIPKGFFVEYLERGEGLQGRFVGENVRSQKLKKNCVEFLKQQNSSIIKKLMGQIEMNWGEEIGKNFSLHNRMEGLQTSKFIPNSIKSFAEALKLREFFHGHCGTLNVHPWYRSLLSGMHAHKNEALSTLPVMPNKDVSQEGYISIQEQFCENIQVAEILIENKMRFMCHDLVHGEWKIGFSPHMRVFDYIGDSALKSIPFYNRSQGALYQILEVEHVFSNVAESYTQLKLGLEP